VPTPHGYSPSEDEGALVANPTGPGTTGVAVPEDLVRWFAGEDVLAKDHGVRRIEVRHRVVEVLGLMGEEGSEIVVPGEVREFKSLPNAKACAEGWEREGRVVLVQHAPLLWLTAAELPGVLGMDETAAEG
jgi:hypothetical protein